MRKDRPAHYKSNFATALLLSGRPSGCIEILSELGAEAPSSAGTIRSAVKRWESTLSTWAWLNWRFYGCAPQDRPVQLDFEPGDFGNAPSLVETGEDLTTPPRNAA